MAQRMESVAPPGGVMLSESTARLVEDAVMLGEPEMVHIKGADDPVPPRRLLGRQRDHQHGGAARTDAGRAHWELNTIAAILDEAIGGAGLRRQCPGAAGYRQEPHCPRVGGDRRRAAVSRCSPPTANPTPATSLSMRWPASCGPRLGVDDLDAEAARARVRGRFPDADPEDLLSARRPARHPRSRRRSCPTSRPTPDGGG